MTFFTEVFALFTQTTELINDNVEAAVKVFNSAVKLAGDCMKRTVTVSYTHLTLPTNHRV